MQLTHQKFTIREMNESLVQYLAQFVTEHKQNLIEDVLKHRTRYLSIVLEDIYQPHNASACIRSCECFGIQDLHIIEKRNNYKINPDVTLGSSKWINMHRYREEGSNNTLDCLKSLKKKGYKIVATSLQEETIPIQELPLDEKIALCFGTEETGLSDDALEMADYYVKIPMVGFTQSFNISVSVAISLFALTERLKQGNIPWQLSDSEKLELKEEWYKKIAPKSEALVRYFYEQKER